VRECVSVSECECMCIYLSIHPHTHTHTHTRTHTQSINAEGAAFKAKLAALVGPMALLKVRDLGASVFVCVRV
jgi:hypothetical protein